ncbi:MAG: FKBP-type peptidyl-prolyl cis-trans isomerase [Janthinobacterium lividum]
MRNRRVPLTRALVGLGLSAVLLALGACGKDSDPAASASPAPSVSASDPATPSASASPSAAPVAPSKNFDAVKVEGAYGKSPKVTVKSPWVIDQTRAEVLQPNAKGAVVQPGSTVEVNYYGVNGRTGKRFDDSFSRGQSIAFPLDQVVPGFSKGLQGQHQGSRVVIAMPGSDGYDSSGGSAQAGINVGDTLVFVVDIVAVPLTSPSGTPVTPKAGLPTVAETGGKPVVTVPKTDPPTSLVVQPLIQGTGKAVGATDSVTINYSWVDWSTGQVLEETYGSKPATAALSSLVPGLQKGLVGQKVGSRVLVVVPPAQGYPQGNATPKVDAGDTLVFVVDVLFTSSAG